MAPQSPPQQLLKYIGQQPYVSGHVQGSRSQYESGKGVNVSMAIHLEYMDQ